MAATDKTYRSQYGLDIVFAVSSLAMLLSIVWMFVDDYNRPFKAEQRSFREAESALAQRLALEQIPSEKEFNEKRDAFDAALVAYESKKDQLKALKEEIAAKQPKREKADADYQTIKADVESISSFYAIAQERNESKEVIDGYRKQLATLNEQLGKAQEKRDEIVQQIKEKQAVVDDIEKGLTNIQSEWKKVTDKFDTQVKVAYSKQWGWGDRIRALPLLDAFASPIRIQQITNNDIPIDYNFKLVTRYDRCTTCHLGIDRPAYTKEALHALTQQPTAEQEKRLAEARNVLAQRIKTFSELPPGAPGKQDVSRLARPDQLAVAQVDARILTEARISAFSAHPRLDLFAAANSKHPMEKFGCSACHSGQGSATDFTLAAHTPNVAKQREHWIDKHDWEPQHMWDFPMLPQRFIESSCLKCHHEVTDLISSNNRVEAPKVLRGYNLIKDNGCFGCHEISGMKGGRPVGPDLRLEPMPPLEDLTATERAKIESDPENRPGNLRKVGPSLYRIKEKTSLAWTVKWIRAPRGFRPDTKMPHFYGVTNNKKDVLAREAPGQEEFPDTEINAAAYYLFQASEKYLKEVAAQHAADKQNPGAGQKDEDRLQVLIARGKERLNKEERDELTALRERIKLRNEVVLTDLAPRHAGDPKVGRRLFTERGCLACHTHEGTDVALGSAGSKDYVPGVHSEALFGPNLSQVAVKLGTTPGDKQSARTWLIQWIKDPHVHSPRSRMPVTHLTDDQAADIAEWLLSQPPRDLGAEWDSTNVPEPDMPKLQELARVYLVRLLPKSDIETLFTKGKLPAEIVSSLPQDERNFAEELQRGGDGTSTYKYYLGRKAVGRLGCYACHDIPGFDTAKPIGVALNDWGKKPPDRLAFENIDNFLERHFYSVKSWNEESKLPGPKLVKEDGHEVRQMPYEAFFYDDLRHHGRTGYLHQKLLDPRSYDYTKILAWDDRSRMPQFRFARARRHEGESDADFEARAWKEEADAREAVMCFILGLTAEQIPEKVINQPRGDRLMEVKGRQVLDKFNCGGCHLVRPGAYDLKVNEDSLKVLREAYASSQATARTSGMHSFPMDHFWTGRPQVSPEKVVIPGIPKRAIEDEDDPKAPYTLQMVLGQALRFNDPQTGMPSDIGGYSILFLPLQTLSPALKNVKSVEDFERALDGQNPFGGRFADLMVPYLIKKDKDVYKKNPVTYDSAEARASLPPSLIGEGARTQPQWLYQFLLDPTQVRRMSILRMPKFNMSKQDAKQLVDYFAGVERITNPGIGLTYPGDHIPQQAPLDDPFWLQKNSEYLGRLQSTGPKEGTTWFDERIRAYEEAWKHAARLQVSALDLNVERAKQQKDDVEKQIKALKEKIDKADAKEKVELQKSVGDLEASGKAAAEQLQKLQEALKEAGPAAFKQAWQENQAYVSDAYRMIANKAMCLQCHQVAGFKSSNPTTEGPPLALVNERLRPDWVYRWIATPQRHLTYESLMPVNFPKLQPGEQAKLLEVLAGQPLERIEAIRDTLMNYPRVVALPVNQMWNPNLQAAPPPDK
jgi:mono/diheme cytochrome c family protein/cbb3-type cytochrome oxidase cytochrome c subunit